MSPVPSNSCRWPRSRGGKPTLGFGAALVCLGLLGAALGTRVATAQPALASQPSSSGIRPYESRALFVRLQNSRQPVSYQWFLGESGDTTIPIPGATNLSFRTPALTTSASYWVRVTSTDGFVDSSSAELRIAPSAGFSEISRWENPRGEIRRLEISGNLALGLVQPQGLQIVDLSHPEAPEELSFVPIPGVLADGLSVRGSLAYIPAPEAGLQILDIRVSSDPPSRADPPATSNWPRIWRSWQSMPVGSTSSTSLSQLHRCG